MKINKVKDQVIALRLKGHSVRQIAKELNIKIGSAGYYSESVPLTTEQLASLEKRDPAKNPDVLAGKIKKRFYDIRLGFQTKGAKMAKRYDHKFIAGCMLYWAEGAKNKNTFSFINTDVHMVKFMKEFLYRYFPNIIPKIKFVIRLHDTETKPKEEVLRFWSELLNQPIEAFQFRQAPASKTSKCQKLNKHVYGCCIMYVCSTELVQTVFGAIQEYCGFKKEAWLTRGQNYSASSKAKTKEWHHKQYKANKIKKSLVSNTITVPKNLLNEENKKLEVTTIDELSKTEECLPLSSESSHGHTSPLCQNCLS